MQIVIVHYHLQTGGVTRVIEHACRALTAAGHHVLVLAGEPPSASLASRAPIAVVPGLGYEERRAAQSPDRLAADMQRAARERFGSQPDVWHLHNHCLGKNLALPGAVVRLARDGQRLLLQPHDFAEDGRPFLYRRLRDRLADGDVGRLSALLYPQAPQIHYAALNARDLSFLAAAGVPSSRLHLLPNAVSVPTSGAEAGRDRPAPGAGSSDARLWLYPTRAIRRKNLGEFLLWSALAGPGDRFATTQAPQNPQEQSRYRRWVALAMALGLPIELELGSRVEDFSALIAASHALVTTSVAEGFGLAFLEPWLGGRALAGRDLPEITRDFRASGIRLDGLYERLLVPLSWIDAERLRGVLAEALDASASAYGRMRDTDAVQRAWRSATVEDRIDMGRLDEPAQESVIRRVLADSDARSALSPSTLTVCSDPAVIAANGAAVRAHYDLAEYGQRLIGIYSGLNGARPSSRLDRGDGDALLDRFLAPERLTLLRT